MDNVGFTCSQFDLLHLGHLTMLQECKLVCDYLIVGLQTDASIDRPKEKSAPVQSVYERWVQLDACKYVDKIIPYTLEQDLIDILTSQPIDVRILGVEYKDKDFTGREECQRLGIDIHFNERNHRFSSTELRTRLK